LQIIYYCIAVLIYVNVVCFIADEDICVAAGVPLSDSAQFAVLWMKNYFDLCDRSPSTDKTYVNVSEKSDVYNLYVGEFKQLNTGEPLLQKNKFLSLWAVLFPLCVKRPHCDIPGKCATCYEIDRIRRESEPKIIHEMCKQAHALHRGGLFMQERIR
jgi:hypothetical protein